MPFSELDIVIDTPIQGGYTKEPKTVGNHIRNKRLLENLTQQEVSLFLGIDHKVLANWELRKAFPQFKYFPKIIQFLGYNPVPLDTTTIQGRILLCCMNKGLTRIQLSRRLGVSLQTLSDWESRVNKPGEKANEAIVQLLKN